MSVAYCPPRHKASELSYRPRRRRTRDGRIRWALERSCLEHATCDHWTLLPWRFSTRAEAESQALKWQQAQRVLLSEAWHS